MYLRRGEVTRRTHTEGEAIDTRDRRFSDEEFALIIQRAAELQDRAGGAAAQLPNETDGAMTAAGLSLEAVREIGQEVGLEARFVEQAAASLEYDPFVKEPSLLGGPHRHHLGDTFARTLTDVERVELLDVIRGVQENDGKVNEVMGSLEWRSVGRMTGMTVTINSNDERVVIRVVNDLSGIAALTWIASIVTGLAAGGLIVAALPPASLVVTGAILGAGGTAGVGVARTIWSATTRAFRRRAERLREEIARYLSR